MFADMVILTKWRYRPHVTDESNLRDSWTKQSVSILFIAPLYLTIIYLRHRCNRKPALLSTRFYLKIDPVRLDYSVSPYYNECHALSGNNASLVNTRLCYTAILMVTFLWYAVFIRSWCMPNKFLSLVLVTEILQWLAWWISPHNIGGLKSPMLSHIKRVMAII